jgi:catechol 2,3-dioxygenase-like lactoylglutathione lyase family enzyme
MSWSIHRASLLTHDLAVAERFFGTLLGLGAATRIDGQTLAFGGTSRGLRVHRPHPALARPGGELLGSVGSRHVAVDVADLNRVVGNLDKAAVPHVEARAGEFDVPAVYTIDPAMNVVAFCQRGGAETPRMHAPDWHIHHVNLEAKDVREAVGFYTEIVRMAEGCWQAPAAMGDFSIDPAELAVLPLGDDNSGLHIIRPDPGFAYRNSFAHNPSIGGHPAFCVRDVKAVKVRLEEAGILVSDAGVYAMAGMQQIYVLDPSANMIEVNQVV